MSGQGGIRLLVSDVDGTLLPDDKVLTEATMTVVRELREAGVALALSSSRPPRGMSMLFQPLDLQGPIAGLNGGLFVNADLSVIQCIAVDPAAASQSVARLLAQGLDVWVYTEADWAVRNAQAPHVAREAWILKYDAKVVSAFTDADLANAVKIVGVSDDLDLIAASQKAVEAELGAQVSIVRSQSYFLDVTNPGANKGAVVDVLSQRLDIPAEQIATIGDMPNDVLMFRKSGFSIAMGNASDEVKAQASAVTDSNARDGFAKAVRQYVLPLAGG